MRSLIFALLFAAQAWSAGAADFEIAPQGRLTSSQHVQIALAGVYAGQMVEIRAERLSQNGRDWFAASARYRADADGRIDLTWSPSLGGSYLGVDAEGLFWSMSPSVRPNHLTAEPGRYYLTAKSLGGDLLAEHTLILEPSAPDLTETSAPFPGAFLVRPAERRLRGVLIALGGSEGGDLFARGIARRLASHGYAVLGLPYYKSEGTPQTFEEIPVDRLNEAHTWLITQPGFATERVGLIGVSKGAEFAVLASSLLPWVSSVVAYAPSDVVWEGWGSAAPPGSHSSFSFNGESLSFLAYDEIADAQRAAAEGAPFDLIGTMVRARRNRTALETSTIAVEQFKGPMLLIAGDDDQVCPSAEMAQRISARRLRHGLPTEVHVYRNAGHYVVGDAFSGAFGSEDAGGTRAGNAFARRDGWSRTLAFLNEWSSVR